MICQAKSRPGRDCRTRFSVLSLGKAGACRRRTAELPREAEEAERAEADPESAANVEKRRRTSEDMIEAAKAEIARIERHNAELDAAVREAGAKIDALEGSEDYDYYRAICDEYMEGRAYVEELLARD